ncbi:hypothetical protein HMF8227_00975 [Saliniradius amylolyticus]|uniref:Uncharacterized protein n=1 Tax=Saliniradius amylolyticus TaxID=2183582 RepID=A0A2S2E1F0_9ALTE|nr:hypothetical protein [Saliniradius amylolyticus]AWL11468.1 hypothetical protein HMF8227_00975 [Saliniradius amylolyticus]
MFNDLLFPILPKEGKVPIPREEMRIKSIAKEAKLRPLNDEEKAMTTDEREIHEIYRKHQQGQRDEEQAAKRHAKQSEPEPEEKDSAKKQNDKTDTDKDGWTKDGHLDIYV